MQHTYRRDGDTKKPEAVPSGRGEPDGLEGDASGNSYFIVCSKMMQLKNVT